MFVTTAHYSTPNGSKYLQQLCKHFAHKVEVSFDEHRGDCALPSGPAKLQADGAGLTVTIRADSAKDMIHSRFVIDSHLVTFAHREGFTGLTWEMVTEGAEAA